MTGNVDASLASTAPRGGDAVAAWRHRAVPADALCALLAGVVALLVSEVNRMSLPISLPYLVILFGSPVAWAATVAVCYGHERRFLGLGPDEYRARPAAPGQTWWEPRVGLGGRAFTMLKFRSVVPGTEQLLGQVRAESDAWRRMRVKPGVTGLWQVSGRSDLSWGESLRLDLRYVDNWSMMLDIQILWRTIRAVVRGTGAY